MYYTILKTNKNVVHMMFFQMMPLWTLYNIKFGRRTLYKVEKGTIFDIVVRAPFTNLISSSLLNPQSCSWYHTMHHHQFCPYICICLHTLPLLRGSFCPYNILCRALPLQCSIVVLLSKFGAKIERTRSALSNGV